MYRKKSNENKKQSWTLVARQNEFKEKKKKIKANVFYGEGKDGPSPFPSFLPFSSLPPAHPPYLTALFTVLKKKKKKKKKPSDCCCSNGLSHHSPQTFSFFFPFELYCHSRLVLR